MPNHLMYDYAVHCSFQSTLYFERIPSSTVSAFSAKVNNLFTLFSSFPKSLDFRLRKLAHFRKLLNAIKTPILTHNDYAL